MSIHRNRAGVIGAAVLFLLLLVTTAVMSRLAGHSAVRLDPPRRASGKDQPPVQSPVQASRRPLYASLLGTAAIGVLTLAAIVIVAQTVSVRVNDFRASRELAQMLRHIPSRPVPPQAVFAETFNSPLDELWQRQGPSPSLERVEGRQLLRGSDADDGQDVRLVSRRTFDRRPGLALVTVVRPTVQRIGGPFLLLSGETEQGRRVTAGWAGDQFGGRNAWVPIGPAGQTIYARWADNHDTVLITVLRERGFFNLLAGGPLSELPVAQLAHVSSSPISARYLRAELQAGRATASIESVSVTTLALDDTAVATVWDSFQRTASLGLGGPDKGTSDWRVIEGDWVVDGTAHPRDGGLAVTEIGQHDGWVETTLRTPASGPFQAGIAFDVVDDANYWRWVGSDTRVQLIRVVDGVETLVYETGAVKLNHNTDHRLAVYMNGAELSLLLDDTNALLTESDPYVREQPTVRTGAGLWSRDGNARFTSFAAWPQMVRLPDDWQGLLRPAAAPIAEAQSVDTFGAVAPVPLSGHQPSRGGRWTEILGRWRVGGNAAILDTGPGLALVYLDTLDMVAEVDVRLNREGDTGLVLRAEGLFDRLQARMAWNDGSPDLSVFENVRGTGRFINAVSLAGRVRLGESHRLTFVAVGRDVAAYIDGQLVLQGTMSNDAFQTLRTRGAGLSVDGSASAEFRNFRAGAAR